jgi:hypothetical protein
MLSSKQGQDLFSTGINDLPQNAFNQMPPNSPLTGPPVLPQGGNGLFGPSDQGFGSLQPRGQRSIQMGHPLHQSNPTPQEHPAFLPANPSAFGPTPNQNRLPMHHPIAYHPSQNGFAAHRGPGDSQSAMLNNFGKPGKGSIPALWNGSGVHQGPVEGSRAQVSHGSDGFRLDAAVEFLEHSKHHSTAVPGVVAGMNEIIGLPHPVGVQRNVSARNPLIGFQKGRDDAQMVDSLFGPAGSAGNGASLLTGLEGLSINREGASTGLWGMSNASDGGSLKGLPSLGALAPGPDDPLLFADSQPTMSATEWKSQSRFAWGESGGR